MASNLTIQKQDITKMAVDCIVNAANAHLQLECLRVTIVLFWRLIEIWEKK